MGSAYVGFSRCHEWRAADGYREEPGHKDTRMVEHHYGHLAPSFIADAIRAGAPRYGMEDDRKVVPYAPRS